MERQLPILGKLPRMKSKRGWTTLNISGSHIYMLLKGKKYPTVVSSEGSIILYLRHSYRSMVGNCVRQKMLAWLFTIVYSMYGHDLMVFYIHIKHIIWYTNTSCTWVADKCSHSVFSIICFFTSIQIWPNLLKLWSYCELNRLIRWTTITCNNYTTKESDREKVFLNL